MNRTFPVLEEILSETSRCLSEGHDVWMVFDLDSTLFDVSPRIQQILQDFAGQSSIQAFDPEGARILSQLKADRKEWGIRSAVERAGLITTKPQLADMVRDFWVKNFFTNEYLKYDQPLDGAVSFVNFVHVIGAKIIYLTGRDTSKMHSGSLAGLRHHNFPLSDDGIELVMKPASSIDDAAFKATWFEEVLAQPNRNQQLAKSNHQQQLATANHQQPSVPPKTCKIWFYENEPINLDKVRLNHPEVELVFVDTTHSQKMPSPADLKTIDDFSVDWQRLAPRLSAHHAKLIPKVP